MKRKYAPSKIVPVRFHLEEIKYINKQRKRKSVSEYIRSKALDLTNSEIRIIGEIC